VITRPGRATESTGASRSVDRVDGFPASFHVPDIVEGLPHRISRGHADKFCSHDRSGGVLGILQQTADVDPDVGVQQIEQFGAVRFFHLVEYVGNPIGRHAGKQPCGGIPRHQRDDFGFAVQPGLVKHFNGEIERQMKQNPGCEFCRHVVESFDDIGPAFVDHAGGEKCRIEHVIMLRHQIQGVRLGHDFTSPCRGQTDIISDTPR
jgi:hypothetical protein